MECTIDIHIVGIIFHIKKGWSICFPSELANS